MRGKITAQILRFIIVTSEESMRPQTNSAQLGHRIGQGRGSSVEKNIFRRLAMGTEFTDTPMPTLPLVEIAGACRVLIENHQGVIGYEPSCIQIRTKIGNICVEGEHLELACMTKGKLVIMGQIHSVSLLGG